MALPDLLRPGPGSARAAPYSLVSSRGFRGRVSPRTTSSASRISNPEARNASTTPTSRSRSVSRRRASGTAGPGRRSDDRGAMGGFPRADELPIPAVPMSALMHAVVRLRLNGLGYRRVARELGIAREQARSYARAAGLGGVCGHVPRREQIAIVRATSCARCGLGIAVRQRGRPARFCSRRCRDATNYVTRKARREAVQDGSRGVVGTVGPNGSRVQSATSSRVRRRARPAAGSSKPTTRRPP